MPMETVFDSCPVTSDRVYPLLRRLGVVDAIADVIPIFAERDTPAGTGVLNAYSATGMREVHCHRLNSGYADTPGFDAAMAFLGDVKKGEATVRVSRRALMVG